MRPEPWMFFGLFFAGEDLLGAKYLFYSEKDPPQSNRLSTVALVPVDYGSCRMFLDFCCKRILSSGCGGALATVCWPKHRYPTSLLSEKRAETLLC